MDKLRFKLYPHQVTAFVLMPDGHLLSAEQKVGKDSPKRTKVLLENSPSGGLRFPPSAQLRRALSPLNALEGGGILQFVLRLRKVYFLFSAKLNTCWQAE